jgi:hypothetical protein
MRQVATRSHARDFNRNMQSVKLLIVIEALLLFIIHQNFMRSSKKYSNNGAWGKMVPLSLL